MTVKNSYRPAAFTNQSLLLYLIAFFYFMLPSHATRYCCGSVCLPSSIYFSRLSLYRGFVTVEKILLFLMSVL